MERGLKSECESHAAAVRAEIGLDTRAPLDPRALASHLEIPIHPVSSLVGDGVIQAAVRHVTQVDQTVLSAMTIFPDWPRHRRVIILNDANSPARQNSDIAHELSHGLRMHEPRHAIVNGCRDYSRAEEEEAAWLAGCLLVPRDAAFTIALSRVSLDMAAIDYGVSTQLMTWRVNATGARAQAARVRARRGRAS